jgi:hypothetical protein
MEGASNRLADERRTGRDNEPRSERSCAFLKASRGLPAARILRHACEVVMQSV